MKIRFWRDEGPDEKKDVSWPLETPPAGDTSWLFPVGMEQAVGLPAVMAVIRLLAHAAGIVPLLVLRGQEGDVRQRASDTYQWQLLRRRPGPPPQTPFHFKADLAAQLAGRGQVFVRKYAAGRARVGEAGPRVTELLPMRADRVKAKRKNGQIVFDDYSEDNWDFGPAAHETTRTTDEIIQIRSFSLDGGVEGVSPLSAARMAVIAGLKRQEAETMHMANGIFPGLGFKWPSGVSVEQAKEWIDDIENRHKSTRNAGRLIFLGGGADLVPIPISLEDAQFAEMTRLTISQVAGMYQIPMSFFTPPGPGWRPPSDEDWRFFLTFGLGPIMASISDALTADETLFPIDGEELYVFPQTDALLMLNPEIKAQVQLQQVQSGARLVNEIRADDGLGPLPPVPEDWTQDPGNVPQITPVGGAPNPTASTVPTKTGEKA